MRMTRLSGAELRRLSRGDVHPKRAVELADRVNDIAFPFSWAHRGWHGGCHYSHNLRRNWRDHVAPYLVEAGWADPFGLDQDRPFSSSGATFVKRDWQGSRCVEDWHDLYNSGDTYTPTLWAWIGHGTYWCTLDDVVRTMERRGFRSSESSDDLL